MKSPKPRRAYKVTIAGPNDKEIIYEFEAPSEWTANQRALGLAGKYPYELEAVDAEVKA